MGSYSAEDYIREMYEASRKNRTSGGTGTYAQRVNNAALNSASSSAKAFSESASGAFAQWHNELQKQREDSFNNAVEQYKKAVSAMKTVRADQQRGYNRTQQLKNGQSQTAVDTYTKAYQKEIQTNDDAKAKQRERARLLYEYNQRGITVNDVIGNVGTQPSAVQQAQERGRSRTIAEYEKRLDAYNKQYAEAERDNKNAAARERAAQSVISSGTASEEDKQKAREYLQQATNDRLSSANTMRDASSNAANAYSRIVDVQASQAANEDSFSAKQDVLQRYLMDNAGGEATTRLNAISDQFDQWDRERDAYITDLVNGKHFGNVSTDEAVKMAEEQFMETEMSEEQLAYYSDMDGYRSIINGLKLQDATMSSPEWRISQMTDEEVKDKYQNLQFAEQLYSRADELNMEADQYLNAGDVEQYNSVQEQVAALRERAASLEEPYADLSTAERHAYKIRFIEINLKEKVSSLTNKDDYAAIGEKDTWRPTPTSFSDRGTTAVNPGDKEGNMADVYLGYMDASEREVYYALVGQKNYEEAQSYYEAIEYRLKQRHMEKVTGMFMSASEENPAAMVVINALTNATVTPVMGIVNIGENIASGGTTGMSSAALASQLNASVTQGVALNLEGHGLTENQAEFLSGVITSIANNLTQTAFLRFAPTGTMSEFAQKIAGFVPLAMMGTNAAAETLNEQLQGGSTLEDALLYSAIVGGMEIVTEKIGLDEFLNATGSGVEKTILGKLISKNGRVDFGAVNKFVKAGLGLANQMLSEAGEESISEIVDGIADIIINGERSAFYQNYAAYIAKGYSEDEARSMACKDFAKQVAQSALAGAVSGGVFGVAGGAGIVMNYNNIGNSILRTDGMGGYYSRGSGTTLAYQMIEDGMQFLDGSNTKAFATQLYTDVVENGKQLTAGDISSLYYMMESDMQHSSDDLVKATETEKGKAALSNLATEVFRTGTVSATDAIRVSNVMNDIANGKSITDAQIRNLKLGIPAVAKIIGNRLGYDYLAVDHSTESVRTAIGKFYENAAASDKQAEAFEDAKDIMHVEAIRARGTEVQNTEAQVAAVMAEAEGMANRQLAAEDSANRMQAENLAASDLIGAVAAAQEEGTENEAAISYGGFSEAYKAANASASAEELRGKYEEANRVLAQSGTAMVSAGNGKYIILQKNSDGEVDMATLDREQARGELSEAAGYEVTDAELSEVIGALEQDGGTVMSLTDMAEQAAAAAMENGEAGKTEKPVYSKEKPNVVAELISAELAPKLSRFGIKEIVVDYDGEYVSGNENGRYDEDTGTIYLNGQVREGAKIGFLDGKVTWRMMNAAENITFILGHEITHPAQGLNFNTKESRERTNQIIYMYQEHTGMTDAQVNERVRQLQARYQEHENRAAEKAGETPRKIGPEYARQEFASDAMGMMLMETNGLRNLSASDKSGLGSKIMSLAKGLRSSISQIRLEKGKGSYADALRVMQKTADDLVKTLEKNLKETQGERAASGTNENRQQEADARSSITDEMRNAAMDFANDIQEWDDNGRTYKETFILGTTGTVLQGLGAIENDIYMLSDKIEEIQNGKRHHPEMSIDVIKKIPDVLNDPILVMKSNTAYRASTGTTRLTMFGNVTAEDGRPVMVVLDLRPVENGYVVDDMQKVTSAYTKDTNPSGYIQKSDVLYADKKRTTPLLRTAGLEIPAELQRSGYIGSISYVGQNVKIEGVPFSEMYQQKNLKETQGERAASGTNEKSQPAVDGSGAAVDGARDVRFSVAETESGQAFVVVDTDQHIFDGLTVSEMAKAARDVIRNRFVGKHIGVDYSVYVSGKSAKEYAFPANRRVSSDVKEAKFRASTELDNLIMASTFVRNEADNGHHPEADGGFDKLETHFVIGNQAFSGEISVRVVGDERIFHDLTKIKNITESTFGLAMINTASESSGDINYTITRNSNSVNTESTRSSISDDKSYFAAVNSGDIETAQRLVDIAATKAGAVTNDDGTAKHLYHGTGRADRVGTVFLPERATSGPMAFFTDNQEVAERYSRDKADTSIAYDDRYSDYQQQFRTTIQGKDVALQDAWMKLPVKERVDLRRRAFHVAFDDDYENIVYDESKRNGNGNFDYELRDARGNVFAALNNAWLQSGDLYDNEESFLDVLRESGVYDALERAGFGEPQYFNPDARDEKVYGVYLMMKNMFDATSQVNEGFVQNYLDWYSQQDESMYQRESADADMWDKNSVTAEMFAQRMRENITDGNSNAWTSIPDSMTDYLKSLGYDGIVDRGGKNGGVGHNVYVPFSSEQVKSADPVTYDDAGEIIPLSQRFDDESPDIRFSIQEDIYGNAYVQIDEDILAGVPEDQWGSVVRDNLKKKFPNGFIVDGVLVNNFAKTRGELTTSKDTRFLQRHEQTTYGDKLRATNNLDEIAQAASPYNPQQLEHERKDSFVSFDHGTVLIRVGENGYIADSVIANKASGQKVFYDITYMTPYQIETENRLNSEPTAENGSLIRSSADDDRIADNSDSVNTESRYNISDTNDTGYMDAIMQAAEQEEQQRTEAAKAAAHAARQAKAKQRAADKAAKAGNRAAAAVAAQEAAELRQEAEAQRIESMTYEDMVDEAMADAGVKPKTPRELVEQAEQNARERLTKRYDQMTPVEKRDELIRSIMRKNGALSGGSTVKVSRVATNTFAKGEFFKGVRTAAGEDLQKVIEDLDGYNPISEQESVTEAAHRLDTDYMKWFKGLPGKEQWSGVDHDTAMLILSQLQKESAGSGDYAEVIRWAKIIQQHGTTAAQALQSFAKYTRTATGIMMKQLDLIEEMTFKDGDQKAIESELKSGIDESSKRIKELQQKYDSLNEENKKLLSELDKKLSEQEEARSDRRDAGKELTQTKQRIKQTVASIESYKQKIDELNAENDKLQSELDDLIAKKAPIKGKASELMKQRSKLNRRVRAAEAAIDRTTQLNEHLRKTIDELAGKKGTADAALSVLKSDNKMLADLVMNLTGVSTQTSNLKAKIRKASTLADTRKKIASASEAMQEAMKDMDDMLTKASMTEKKQWLIRQTIDYANLIDRVQEGDKEGLVDVIMRINQDRNFRNSTPNSKLTKKWFMEQDFEFMDTYALNALTNLSGDYKKRTVWEKVSTLQFTNQLGQPKTWIKNIASNTTFMPMESIAENAFGRFIDMLLKNKSGNRAVAGTWGHGGTLGKTWTGAKEGAKRAFLEVRFDVDAGKSKSKYERADVRSTSKRTFKMTQNRLARRISQLEMINGIALTVTDEMYKGATYRVMVDSYANLVARGLATQEQVDQIIEREMKYRTFQDDTFVGTILKGLHDLLNTGRERDADGNKIYRDAEGRITTAEKGGRNERRFGGRKWGLGDVIVKYRVVPGALVVRTIEFSPIGFLNGLYKTAEFVKNGGNIIDQRDAAMAVARGMTGSLVAGVFYLLAKSGIFKRKENEEDKDVAAMEGAQGFTGTQINISALNRLRKGEDNWNEWRDGDSLEDLGFLEPIGALINMGNLTWKLASGEGLNVVDALLANVEIGANAFTDLSMMDTLNDIFYAIMYRDEDETVADLGINLAITLGTSAITGFMPSIIRQAAQASDNYYRDTNATGGFVNQLLGDGNFANGLQGVANSIMLNIPGLRQMVPTKLDPFGNEKTYGNGVTAASVLNTFLNPGRFNRLSETELQQELKAVYDESGDASFYPDRNAPNSLSFGKDADGNDVKVTMTYDQKREYLQVAGDTYKEILAETMSDQRYIAASSTEKAEMLKEIKAYSEYRAKLAFNEKNGSNPDWEDTKWRKTEMGMDAGFGFTEMRGILSDVGAFESEKDDFGDAKSGSIDDQVLDYLNKKRYTDEEKLMLYGIINGGIGTGSVRRLNILMSDSEFTYEYHGESITAQGAGLTFNDAVSVIQEYHKLRAEGSQTALNEQTEMNRWLKANGFSDEQMGVINENYKFYGMIPQQENSVMRKLLDSGVYDDSAYNIAGEIAELEPVDGAEDVEAWQKYDAVLNGHYTDSEVKVAFSAIAGKNNMFSDLDDRTAKKLIEAYRYSSSEPSKRDGSIISMTVSKGVSFDAGAGEVDYDYTDEQKQLYRETYMNAFNVFAGSMDVAATYTSEDGDTLMLLNKMKGICAGYATAAALRDSGVALTFANVTGSDNNNLKDYWKVSTAQQSYGISPATYVTIWGEAQGIKYAYASGERDVIRSMVNGYVGGGNAYNWMCYSLGIATNNQKTALGIPTK